MPSAFIREFALDPTIAYLNHGSFGACLRSVLEHQSELRARAERNPMRFFVRDLPGLLDRTRAAIGDFVGARGSDIVFMTNATAAVNAVAASLDLEPGDELLTTNHAYGACRNALVHWAGRARAEVRVAQVPFPVASPDDVVGAVLASVTARTRLVMLDHITSPTALVFPVAELGRELEGRGIRVLIDGAHAPGMLPLDVPAIGASYYTGNFHKWCGAPKGAAMLWVREDRQLGLHPTVISHGYTSSCEGARFRDEFDWQGTSDFTAVLSIPFAIEALGALADGGMTAVMAKNHSLALEARDLLIQSLGIAPPAPDVMLGSMATVLLGERGPSRESALSEDPIQRELHERFGIEVPLFASPAGSERCLRVSAQLYNTREDYERLVEALAALRVSRDL